MELLARGGDGAAAAPMHQGGGRIDSHYGQVPPCKDMDNQNPLLNVTTPRGGPLAKFWFGRIDTSYGRSPLHRYMKNNNPPLARHPPPRGGPLKQFGLQGAVQFNLSISND